MPNPSPLHESYKSHLTFALFKCICYLCAPNRYSTK